MGSSAIYRPPNWARGPAMVSITVPPDATTPIEGLSEVLQNQLTNAPTTYVFDAVLELEHEQRLEKTRHPVQTGADISSHAYLLPAKVTMFVLMSDAVAAYSAIASATTGIVPTSYSSFLSQAQRQLAAAYAGSPAASGNPTVAAAFTGTSLSKSVNAYQTMLAIQASRKPLTVVTRLRTYYNMMIDSIAPHEDYKTITGLRMRIEFGQILTGSTTTLPVSARPDSTDSNGLGTVNPDPIPTSMQQQFGQPMVSHQPAALPKPYVPPDEPLWGSDALNSDVVDVPGAGDYASQSGQQGWPL